MIQLIISPTCRHSYVVVAQLVGGPNVARYAERVALDPFDKQIGVQRRFVGHVDVLDGHQLHFRPVPIDGQLVVVIGYDQQNAYGGGHRNGQRVIERQHCNGVSGHSALTIPVQGLV